MARPARCIRQRLISLSSYQQRTVNLSRVHPWPVCTYCQTSQVCHTTIDLWYLHKHTRNIIQHGMHTYTCVQIFVYTHIVCYAHKSNCDLDSSVHSCVVVQGMSGNLAHDRIHVQNLNHALHGHCSVCICTSTSRSACHTGVHTGGHSFTPVWRPVWYSGRPLNIFVRITLQSHWWCWELVWFTLVTSVNILITLVTLSTLQHVTKPLQFLACLHSWMSTTSQTLRFPMQTLFGVANTS